MVEFLTTASLSTKTLAGPSIGTPSIGDLYRKALIVSLAIHSAMNSEPKIDDSTDAN
jgi:hypothetical protein